MEKSFVFNSINKDRVYKAEDFASYFASFIGNGVFPNPSNQLQVIDNNDMTITVKEGKAWINGYYYQNTNDFILKLDPADSVLNRIDRVVLRLDFSKRAINLAIKKGEFSSNAAAKKLQRDADAHEIALADIQVFKGAISITQADITDLRLNKNLCGIVHGTVEQVDTTAIFNQFQSWYSQKQQAYDNDVSKWTTEKKQTFNNWYNTNTQAFLKQFNDWYGANTGKWTSDFNVWFSTIKGQLDGDIAANLANKTNELEGKINVLSGESGEKEKLNKETFDTFKTNDFDTFKQSTKSQLAEKAAQTDLDTLNTNFTDFKNTKGKPNGIPDLGADGKVITSQLPELETGAWEKISDVTLQENTAQIDFNNISSNYKKIKLFYYVPSWNSQIASMNILMLINNSKDYKTWIQCYAGDWESTAPKYNSGSTNYGLYIGTSFSKGSCIGEVDFGFNAGYVFIKHCGYLSGGGVHNINGCGQFHIPIGENINKIIMTVSRADIYSFPKGSNFILIGVK